MKLNILCYILLPLSITFSCTSPEELIVRNWKLDHIDASALMADMPKEMQDTLKLMIDQETAYQRGKQSFDIREGGKVVITSPDLQRNWKTINGSWMYNAEDNLLTINMKGKSDEYIVQELTEKKLVLELVDKRAANWLASAVKGNKRPGTKVKSVYSY